VGRHVLARGRFELDPGRGSLQRSRPRQEVRMRRGSTSLSRPSVPCAVLGLGLRGPAGGGRVLLVYLCWCQKERKRDSTNEGWGRRTGSPPARACQFTRGPVPCGIDPIQCSSAQVHQPACRNSKGRLLVPFPSCGAAAADRHSTQGADSRVDSGVLSEALSWSCSWPGRPCQCLLH